MPIDKNVTFFRSCFQAKHFLSSDKLSVSFLPNRIALSVSCLKPCLRLGHGRDGFVSFVAAFITSRFSFCNHPSIAPKLSPTSIPVRILYLATLTIYQPSTGRMPPVTIHCVRHAQGFHNISVTNHAIHDPMLTPYGEEQCKALAKNFPFMDRVDAVVASPMKRTVYTALHSFAPAIKDKRLKVFALPELQETSDLPCDTGSKVSDLEAEFKGQPVDLSYMYTPPAKAWNTKLGKWSAIASAVDDRARIAREWLYNRPEKEIVVVTHGGFLHYFTEDWMEKSGNTPPHRHRHRQRSDASPLLLLSIWAEFVLDPRVDSSLRFPIIITITIVTTIAISKSPPLHHPVSTEFIIIHILTRFQVLAGPTRSIVRILLVQTLRAVDPFSSRHHKAVPGARETRSPSAEQKRQICSASSQSKRPRKRRPTRRPAVSKQRYKSVRLHESLSTASGDVQEEKY
jgi:broad specificity phosphatase PhoE